MFVVLMLLRKLLLAISILLRDEKKFSKLATVINSIDMSKRKNSYGYGYGKKYGYGYGKRYGYGYGYGYETNEKKKSEGK